MEGVLVKEADRDGATNAVYIRQAGGVRPGYRRARRGVMLTPGVADNGVGEPKRAYARRPYGPDDQWA